MNNTAKAVVPVENAPLTPMDMLNRAVSSGADIEVLEKLMGLQERYEKNQARKAFDEAVAAAKAEIPPILRNREGHNQKRYADFAAIAEVVDPIITSHGLSYRFRTLQNDKINVTCILSHKAGHYEETTLSGPADATGSKNAIQAIGSTLTYLQRYSLVQALGLAAANDDDGKASGKRQNPHVTTAEDIIGEAIEVDENGDPVNNIPRGNPEVKRMSKAMARPEYANLLADIRSFKNLPDLMKWGDMSKDRVESLPLDWQEILRGEFRDKMIELGWKKEEK
jgi:ERF superfamily protein